MTKKEPCKSSPVKGLPNTGGYMHKHLLDLVCILVALIMLAVTGGCGPSMAQLKSEEIYYQAREAEKKAQTELIVALINAGGDAAKDNNNIILPMLLMQMMQQSPLQQYQHQDYTAKWVGLIGQVLGIAVPWVGAAAIASTIARHAGSAINQTVNGTGNAASMSSPYADFGVAPPTVVHSDVVVVDPVIVDPVIVGP